jgi:hypothetical protein
VIAIEQQTSEPKSLLFKALLVAQQQSIGIPNRKTNNPSIQPRLEMNRITDFFDKKPCQASVTTGLPLSNGSSAVFDHACDPSNSNQT